LSVSDEAESNLDLCALEDAAPPAAIAGILFSVLLITGLLLFRLSVRADPLETGAWLKSRYLVDTNRCTTASETG
jgi:hypothetical protein